MAKRIARKICQDCKGNGYRRILIEEGREEVITDCETCDNQGEFKVGDEKLYS
jgi:DnaJ-class molecular chaperone